MNLYSLQNLLPKTNGTESDSPEASSKKLFTNGAPALHFPELELFLQNCESCKFDLTLRKSSLDEHADSRLEGMFPPMDRLAASKRSLFDFESNQRRPSTWTSSAIFGPFLSLSLGVTVRNSLTFPSYYSI